MSRKVLFTLATAATLAAGATLASSAADARGFGGGGGGGFGHSSFGRIGGGGGGIGRIGGGYGRIGGGRSFAFRTPIRGGNPGFPGHLHWAHWHHHHWFWRDGRWFYGDGDYGVDGVVAPGPVAAPGPCTCLTKTYTQDGLVVFADVCTKEAASARVDGTDVTPPAKSSSVAPPPAPPAAQLDTKSVADAAQAPTTNNYAGRTYQDFLAANALAQKN
jgi:hypothetical protein